MDSIPLGHNLDVSTTAGMKSSIVTTSRIMALPTMYMTCTHGRGGFNGHTTAEWVNTRQA